MSSSLVPYNNSLPLNSFTPSTVSSISPSSYTHSLYVSDDFHSAKEETFKTFPHQEPHFKPLDKYSPSIRHTMKVALELEFVRLVNTFSQAEDPVGFYKGIADFDSQLTTLEDMGYDVKKLREKFDELRRIAVDGADNREKKEELEVKMRVLQVKAHVNEDMMTELREEMMELEAKSETQEKETQSLESKLRVCTSKEEDNLVSFKAVATKPYL
ncbi:hypothetical protein MKX03_002568 [Papaver bracteatum]|nr:hypothetical protein MKX03_002568 [Papaver bracteatum]